MYQKKNKNNYILWGQLALTVVGLSILLFISFPLFKKMNKQYQVNKEISELKKEISFLEENNQDLLKFIDFMESDQFIIEQARLKLNYKKEGEDVVIIKGKEELIHDRMKIFEQKEVENLNNPQRWLKFFIDPKR